MRESVPDDQLPVLRGADKMPVISRPMQGVYFRKVPAQCFSHAHIKTSCNEYEQRKAIMMDVRRATVLEDVAFRVVSAHALREEAIFFSSCSDSRRICS